MASSGLTISPSANTDAAEMFSSVYEQSHMMRIRYETLIALLLLCFKTASIRLLLLDYLHRVYMFVANPGSHTGIRIYAQRTRL